APQVADAVPIEEELAGTLLAQRSEVLGVARVVERRLPADRALLVQERNVLRRVALRLRDDVARLDGGGEPHAGRRLERRTLDRAVVRAERGRRARHDVLPSAGDRLRQAVRDARVGEVLEARAGDAEPG